MRYSKRNNCGGGEIADLDAGSFHGPTVKLHGSYGSMRTKRDGLIFGQMAAASLAGMIPVYVLALLMQKWLIGGLTQGSVK